MLGKLPLLPLPPLALGYPDALAQLGRGHISPFSGEQDAQDHQSGCGRARTSGWVP